ncbi:MAG: sulfite exporter TauE/SafE family protein [Planctomycetes bacterium]|nr:sulfite exporter TauE/SafE family protein [Planctomycetota bacterium]
MDNSLWILYGTALFIAFIHTVIGPDHYLPFIMLGRANNWPGKKVVLVAVLCGIGHVLSSVILGIVGILAGIGVSKLEHSESIRGEIASYLLIGFGVVYAIWGLLRGLQGHYHSHSHGHIPTGENEHEHLHNHEHAHAVEKQTTFWAVFIIFVLGPCEPLIPLLMFPAAAYGWVNILNVALIFSITTILTMTIIAWLGYQGVKLITSKWIERYVHFLAGGSIAVSGLAIKMFGL